MVWWQVNGTCTQIKEQKCNSKNRFLKILINWEVVSFLVAERGLNCYASGQQGYDLYPAYGQGDRALWETYQTFVPFNNAHVFIDVCLNFRVPQCFCYYLWQPKRKVFMLQVRAELCTFMRCGRAWKWKIEPHGGKRMMVSWHYSLHWQSWEFETD